MEHLRHESLSVNLLEGADSINKSVLQPDKKYKPVVIKNMMHRMRIYLHCDIDVHYRFMRYLNAGERSIGLFKVYN